MRNAVPPYLAKFPTLPPGTKDTEQPSHTLSHLNSAAANLSSGHLGQARGSSPTAYDKVLRMDDIAATASTDFNTIAVVDGATLIIISFDIHTKDGSSMCSREICEEPSIPMRQQAG